MINLKNRKTKIVCTIGPATESPEVISELIDAGMNVARINFSHGTHAEHEKKISTIREIAEKKNVPVAILQDLSGPKIRIGKLKEGIMLNEGDEFTLFADKKIGNNHGVGVTTPEMIGAVDIGQLILLADGALHLRVKKTSSEAVICTVEVGGMLSSSKGINLPESSLEISGMTEKDKRDLDFGVDIGIDIVALSFVRHQQDVFKLRNILYNKGVDIPVFSKIEKHEALNFLDEIINISDGIMVARGDLAVETPLEGVPMIQKKLIKKCNFLGKPVITATQMLKSMVDNPRPTRAEAADVANAMMDGTDAVMLSEETAIGRYPVDAVRTMHKILIEAESSLDTKWALPTQEEFGTITVPAAVSHAAVLIAQDLDIKAIVTPTSSGSTARMISRFRSRHSIIALCRDKATQARLCVVWGVLPYFIDEPASSDQLFELAKKHVKKYGFVRPGDRILIVAGLPPGKPGRTNIIKVEEINTY